MKDEKAVEKRPASEADVESRQWPARAADMQQEPAIPKDVVFPPNAEKPDPAIPKAKKGTAENLPANDDVKTTKAEAKEAAPTLAAITEGDAPAKVAPAKKAAVKAPAKKR